MHCASWFELNASDSLVTHPAKKEKWIILTRNAIHGGVESLIREEANWLQAPVVVCGGHDRKDTCPFQYSRADESRALEMIIRDYDVILYHWLPDWAIEVIKKSNIQSIEFIHRADTSDSDKTVPTALVTHSSFLANYIYDTYTRPCRVVEHAIALDHFVPVKELGRCIGAITSYYETKGIDIFLRSWSMIQNEYPDVTVRFYGAGDDHQKLKKLAFELGVEAEFRGPTIEPWQVMEDFRCSIVPSLLEGLPVAIFETLVMNIPVITNSLPGMIDLVTCHKKGVHESHIQLAISEDQEELARLIRDILQNSIAINSNAYIREYYSAKKHCSDLINVFREICLH